MAQKEFSEKIVDNTRKNRPSMNKAGSIIPAEQISQKLVGVTRPSLGIFGSLSSSIIIRNPDIAENLNLQAQSTFRTISLARPDTLLVIRMMMKSEGYHYYERLSRVAHEFINEFTRRKNQALHGKEASKSDYVDEITERLVIRDLKIAVRFSILLRDQEWKGYLEKVYAR